MAYSLRELLYLNRIKADETDPGVQQDDDMQVPTMPEPDIVDPNYVDEADLYGVNPQSYRYPLLTPDSDTLINDSDTPNNQSEIPEIGTISGRLRIASNNRVKANVRRQYSKANSRHDLAESPNRLTDKGDDYLNHPEIDPDENPGYGEEQDYQEDDDPSDIGYRDDDDIGYELTSNDDDEYDPGSADTDPEDDIGYLNDDDQGTDLSASDEASDFEDTIVNDSTIPEQKNALDMHDYGPKDHSNPTEQMMNNFFREYVYPEDDEDNSHMVQAVSEESDDGADNNTNEGEDNFFDGVGLDNSTIRVQNSTIKVESAGEGGVTTLDGSNEFGDSSIDENPGLSDLPGPADGFADEDYNGDFLNMGYKPRDQYPDSDMDEGDDDDIYNNVTDDNEPGPYMTDNDGGYNDDQGIDDNNDANNYDGDMNDDDQYTMGDDDDGDDDDGDDDDDDDDDDDADDDDDDNNMSGADEDGDEDDERPEESRAGEESDKPRKRKRVINPKSVVLSDDHDADDEDNEDDDGDDDNEDNTDDNGDGNYSTDGDDDGAGHGVMAFDPASAAGALYLGSAGAAALYTLINKWNTHKYRKAGKLHYKNMDRHFQILHNELESHRSKGPKTTAPKETTASSAIDSIIEELQADLNKTTASTTASTPVIKDKEAMQISASAFAPANAEILVSVINPDCYMAIAADEKTFVPMFTMTREAAAPTHKGFFDSPKTFRAAFNAVVAKNNNSAAPELFKSFGAKAITYEVDVDKAVSDRIRDGVVAASQNLEQEKSNLIESINQCLGIAALEIMKNINPDNPNPMRETLSAALTQNGVRHPETLIDEAFATSGPDMMRKIISRTTELMRKSVQVRNEISAYVAQARVNPTPLLSNEIAGKLARASVPFSVSASDDSDSPNNPLETTGSYSFADLVKGASKVHVFQERK